jgi:aromatic ring-opening dioxygenase catalytic subunit (LigB family)
VLILGSGLSYHNLRSFWDASATQDAEAFDTWLAGVIPLAAPARDAALTAWASAPSARRCHPREEHLLPLMVVAGAAGDDVGESDWTGTMMRKRIRSARFG